MAGCIEGCEPFIAYIVDIRLVFLQQISHGDQIPSHARVDQGLIDHLALRRLLLLGDTLVLVAIPISLLAGLAAVIHQRTSGAP